MVRWEGADCKGADLLAPKYQWECHMQARPRSQGDKASRSRGARPHPGQNMRMQDVRMVTQESHLSHKWGERPEAGKNWVEGGLVRGEHLGHTCSLSPSLQPRDGEPVVTQLRPGPVVVQDGHFSRPLGSTDLLRAPAHFPVPSTRVVVREVSFVWHLYGGRDFGPHPGHR